MEELIVKFLQNNITEEELKQLKEGLKEQQNQVLFEQLIALHCMGNHLVPELNLDQFKEELDCKILQESKSSKLFRLPKIYPYAASILLLCALFYFGKYFTSQQEGGIPKDEIQIETSDGNAIILNRNEEKDATVFLQSNQILGTHKGSRLVLPQQLLSHKDEVVYQTLKVPYGKKFELVLSDGTEIYLNSGSSLSFPNGFIKHQERKVSLSGEAYFKVTENSLSPFKVNTDDSQVIVLGTSFNVSSYPESKATQTVLVSGKVSLQSNNEALVLSPGQLGAYQPEKQQWYLTSVDVYDHIAWVDGKLVFRNKEFGKLAKQLERHYNVQITINNEALKTQRFDATFETETIEDILISFQKSSKFSYSYNKNLRKIIIN